MITEDYVSFEIAKLLQEKGFAGETHKIYDETGELHDSSTLNPIPAPTHQMTVKWLREVHNLSIDIDTCIKGFQPYICYGHADINKAGIFICSIHDNRTPEGTFYKYEDAVEAAIKECLTKLINNEKI